MSGTTIPAVILAGGRSSRYGSDKAHALFDGRRLIERAVQLSRHCTERVLIVSKRPEAFQDCDAESIGEDLRICSPMVGIISAIRHLEKTGSYESILVLSCDMVWHPEHLLDHLIGIRTDKAVFLAGGGLLQPFPGRYPLSSRPIFEAAVEQQRFRMRPVLELIPHLCLPADHWWIANINRPEELREAEHDRTDLLQRTLYPDHTLLRDRSTPL